MGNSYEIRLNSARLKEQRLPLLICIFIIGLLGQDTNVFGQEEVGRGAIVKELNLKKSITTIQIDHDDFVWVGTTSGLYRFDGFDFEKLGGDTSGIYPPSTDAIKSLFEDKARHLWIATSKKIYVLTRERDRSLDIASSLPPQSSFQEISNIREVGDEIWVFQNAPEIICFHLTAEDNIRYSRTIKTFTSIPISAYLLNNGNYLIELTVKNHYMLLSPDGDSLETKTPPNENTNFFQDMLSHKLYALASPNLYMVDPEKMSFTKKISFASSFLIPVPGWISSSQRSWGSIWIGSKLGHLIWYTPEKGSYLNLTKLLHDRAFEGRFFSTNVGVEDKNGGLWLGTTLGLVYIKLTALQYFNHLPQPQTVVSKQSFSTRGMVRTHNGDLLVSSYAGLFLYKKNVPVKNYTIWNDVIQGKVDPVVYDFLPERDDILMASEGNSLLRYDYETDSIYRLYSSSYFYHSDDQDVKALQWCFKIFKDHSGIIWLGLNAGLYQYDEKNKMLKAAPVKGATREIGRVTDMVEDSLNTIWLATATGLYSISAERAELKKTNLSYANGPPLQCILSDANGWLWIGTRGHGLFHYHTAKGSLIPFTIEQGLADDLICAIRRGDDNALWISTNQGLSRFDPFRKQFTNFYMEDGLPDNEFNHGSSMKDAEGNLYFGGVNGVVHFHPQKNIFNRPPGHLRISKIITHNGLKGSTTKRLYNSYQRPEIKLGYRDKYFTVYFASSDPTPASRENYAYRLSGLDNAWQMNGGKNSIQFTGLQPGKYVLQIKTLHQTEDEDDILEIPVFIAQPYFKQWWAYVFYFLLIAGIAFLIVQEYFKRLHMNHQLHLEIDHKARLQEINRSKSTFFTNITHEFKTPLTLINGPAEEITRLSTDPLVIKQANLISKSAKSILALVNQLLELGKLEANLEEPQYHRLDLVQHLQQWMQKFIPLAHQKEIKLGFETEQPALYADFDPVKMETVINNLLSNAIKFTQEKGIVKCKISSPDTHTVQLIVEDNGPGIAIDEQELIFDRFYQGKNSLLGGTGIGLSFVREMVRIHGGNVTVQSTPGQGATFIVLIPLYQINSIRQKIDAFANMENDVAWKEIEKPDVTESPVTKEQPVILVAEDHEDVAQLILDVLSKDYQLIHAPNGRDAHQRALELIPDLIITDVMMPIMDGYSFTHLIKNDFHTSHIPVIMLTAKDGEMSRIEGRSSGADGYLQKPFSIQELQLTIRNLLNLKARMTERISKQMAVNAEEVEFVSTVDSTFYRQFLQILEENLSESSLSVDDFITRLGTSRTQLHRKLKAITGLSVSQIVRNVRLQKGLSMLREGNKSIAEIAYEVGFSNPSYFTERFREYYGYPPSEIDKNPIPGPSSS